MGDEDDDDDDAEDRQSLSTYCCFISTYCSFPAASYDHPHIPLPSLHTLQHHTRLLALNPCGCTQAPLCSCLGSHILRGCPPPAGTLVPDVTHLYLRMSPGFCIAAYGAVEDTDWRNFARVSSTKSREDVVFLYLSFQTRQFHCRLAAMVSPSKLRERNATPSSSM